jgi:hypothetical protein
MRLLLALLVLLAAAPQPARADPPRFDIVMPAPGPAPGQPFTVEIRRVGDWNIQALQNKAYENFVTGRTTYSFSSLSVSLDGAPIATLMLAYDAGSPINWLTPAAWRVNVTGLALGVHEFVAFYTGDALNNPDPAVLSLAIAPSPFTPTKPPKPLDPLPSIMPLVLPQGIVALTDARTSAVTLVDIATLLLTDPFTGVAKFDLSSIPDDTIVTYGGDPNYAPFNLTYSREASSPAELPAPAAPLGLALAALAMLHRRGRFLLHWRRLARMRPCHTPTSSISASIPAIR